MGSRGPVPEPAAIKLLKGNPGKRAIRETAQDATRLSVPRCPAFLHGDASREWSRIADIMKRERRISTADRAVMTAYCLCWERVVQLARQYAIETARKAARDARPKRKAAPAESDDPVIALIDDLSARVAELEDHSYFDMGKTMREEEKHLALLADKLGLTVVARMRLPAPAPEKKVDPFEEMLRGSKRA